MTRISLHILDTPTEMGEVEELRLENLDLHYEGLAGAAAGKRLADLSERYGKVIRVTGMKVE